MTQSDSPNRTEPADDQSGIVAFITTREGKCADCGTELPKGTLLCMDKERALCLDCGDLGHLEFLPRGDAALTRRASKYSELRAVVLQWSRSRRRYERQGVLVAPEAIRKAEEECLADAGLRELRRQHEAVLRAAADREYVAAVAEKLGEMFPGCPLAEREQIAAHACAKYSGRVGRSAAARDFDPQAFRLAVIAHVRHCHTSYDRLLARGADRHEARAAVRLKIEDILARWETGIATSPVAKPG